MFPQLQIIGHGLFLVQQGVPRPPQVEILLRQPGLRTVQLHGQPAPGEDLVQPHQQTVILADILLVGGALGRQGGQDALDLLLLLGLKLPQLIVGLYHTNGFDKEGGPGGGHIVDQTGDGILVLRLHRHHIAVRPDGDNGFLQILGLVGGDQLLQNFPHFGLSGPHMPADRGQFRTGGIGDLFLPQNGIRNGLL